MKNLTDVLLDYSRVSDGYSAFSAKYADFGPSESPKLANFRGDVQAHTLRAYKRRPNYSVLAPATTVQSISIRGVFAAQLVNASRKLAETFFHRTCVSSSYVYVLDAHIYFPDKF